MYEYLNTLKESAKSKVYLVYNEECGRMEVEKRFPIRLAVYWQLAKLPHPYLPRLYGVTYENGETVVREEYINGPSIGQVKATEKQITRWLIELCQVLSFLHRHKIVHRDIKPSNLLIGTDGHIRLIDFDAAREEKQQADSDTRLLGTKGYAPPEQYGFAQTDKRSDIYALGVTFRELLGERTEKRHWKKILKRCTAIDPKQRYRSVWQIRWAVIWARFRRWVLTPLWHGFEIFLWLGIIGSIYAYHTDEDWRNEFQGILSFNRSEIFTNIDMKELKHSDVVLASYLGDENAVYAALLQKYPDITFISTGYADERGHLLWGGFRSQFDVKSGKQQYIEFLGLYTEERIITDYEAYAPAVVELYRMAFYF